MKILVRIVVLANSAIFLTGCIGTRAYLTDRYRDALDMVTFSAEAGTVGITAQAAFLETGLAMPITDPPERPVGYGVRGGQIGRYTYAELHIALIGFNTFYLSKDRYPRSDERSKGFEKCHLWFTPGLGGPRSHVEAHPCYGNFELMASFGIGLRVGFNVLEAVDFLLGWVGIDFLKDDVQMQKLQKLQKELNEVGDDDDVDSDEKEETEEEEDNPD